MNVFTDGLNAAMEPATSLEDYERKAQAAAYDGERAMFEAYGAINTLSTGVIQWMLNNAWPSLIWHLYDYYLVPGGGYFGTKKAMEPLHVQYGYDDQSVAVVNDTYVERKGMKVRARVYSLDGKLLADKEESVDVPADGAVKAFDLPKPDGLTMTYFVQAGFAGCARPSGQRQLLLAFDKAGHAGLGQQAGHRVHAASRIWRFDGIEFVAAGETANQRGRSNKKPARTLAGRMCA